MNLSATRVIRAPRYNGVLLLRQTSRRRVHLHLALAKPEPRSYSQLPRERLRRFQILWLVRTGCLCLRESVDQDDRPKTESCPQGKEGKGKRHKGLLKPKQQTVARHRRR